MGVQDRHDDRRDGQGGFTLAELLVGIIVFTLLVFGVFSVLDTNVRSARMNKAKTEVGQDLRQSLAHICDQIRVANQVTTAEPQRMTFTGYVTGDNTLYTVSIYLPEGSDTVYYSTAPAVFGAAETALVTGVDSLTFRYFDSQQNETANLDYISMVEVELGLSRGSAGTVYTGSSKSRVNLRR